MASRRDGLWATWGQVAPRKPAPGPAGDPKRREVKGGSIDLRSGTLSTMKAMYACILCIYTYVYVCVYVSMSMSMSMSTSMSLYMYM